MKKLLSVSFIGNGNHARRIQGALKALKIHYKEIEYNRNIPLSDQIDVIRSDAIFITSPNDTHGQYLEQLEKIYDGYIYCEKPPVNKLEELPILDKINSNKCFFGFNFRYSPVLSVLSSTRNEFNLGSIVAVEIHCSYPFAVRPEYLGSWKSDCDRSPRGVLENLGVHYIDMSVSLCGSIQTSFVSLTSSMNDNRAPDTASISLVHSDSIFSNIFVSYATSFLNRIYLTLENGDIHYDGFKIDVYSPRESFNSRGLSIRPPLSFKKELDSETAYQESLCECVRQFIQVVSTGGQFESELSERSREVTSAMLVGREI